MTALAAGRQPSRANQGKNAVPQKGSTTIYAGGMLGIDTSGYGVAASALASLVIPGIARTNGGLDRWAVGAGDGLSNIEYDEGCFDMGNSASSDEITAADVGKPCYVVDDQTVALTDNSGARPPAGIIRRVESSRVYVEMSLEIGRRLSRDRRFVSAETTGTGSAQNVAHPFGTAPSKVVVMPTELAADLAAGYDAAQGTHTATNIVLTVTSGAKFVVVAWP